MATVNVCMDCLKKTKMKATIEYTGQQRTKNSQPKAAGSLLMNEV